VGWPPTRRVSPRTQLTTTEQMTSPEPCHCLPPARLSAPLADVLIAFACGSLAPGRRTDTNHGRGHGLYCTTHTPSCGRDHTTTINYCAVQSQPGTSYTSQDYDSISVIDSSSPSARKRKPTKQRKPNRHNNRHNKANVRAMNSFSAGSRL
jgi:hypothetical protein